MNKLKLLAFLAMTVTVTGCHGAGGTHEKQAGGMMGSQSGAPVTPSQGVLLGGLLGSEAGKSLDDADQAYMNQQTNRVLESAPTNQPATWKNPDGGDQAQVVPTRTYQQADGTYCRDYTQSIVVKGQTQTARGAACRQSDGSWRSVS